jgi:1-phosphatidylinositol-4-phosphate 5-kinase
LCCRLPACVLSLAAGERYDGEWQEGQEGGIGVFTWRDGSTYEGFWEGGKKTGVGVFRPAPNTPALPASDTSSRLTQRPVGDDAGADMEQPRSPLGSPTAADAPLDSPSANSLMRHRDALMPGGQAAAAVRAVVAVALLSKHLPHVQIVQPVQEAQKCCLLLQFVPPPAEAPRAAAAAGSGAGAGPAGLPGGAEVVFVCQYEAGKLMHEEALSTQDLELIFGPGKVRLGWAEVWLRG